MHYLFYHGNITIEGARNLEVLLSTAVDQGMEQVTIALSSNGGDINAGVGLYNYIEMLPLRVNTHCFGLCESIAATILLSGYTRSAEPMSSFMLHAATFSSGPHKGEISPHTELIYQPFIQKLDWSTDEISARFGKDDFRLSAIQAKDLSLVNKVACLKMTPDDSFINVNIP